MLPAGTADRPFGRDVDALIELLRSGWAAGGLSWSRISVRLVSGVGVLMFGGAFHFCSSLLEQTATFTLLVPSVCTSFGTAFRSVGVRQLPALSRMR